MKSPLNNKTKLAKAKLFENPIKPVETTMISSNSKLEGRSETEGNLINRLFSNRDYNVWSL